MVIFVQPAGDIIANIRFYHANSKRRSQAHGSMAPCAELFRSRHTATTADKKRGQALPSREAGFLRLPAQSAGQFPHWLQSQCVTKAAM